MTVPAPIDRRADVAAREVQPLPQFDRRRLVAYAEQQQVHVNGRRGRAERERVITGTCGSW